MKLLVIDGNSIMNRAFYGIRLLTNKKGAPTNALTGFMNIYLKLLKEEQPDHIAVAFDLHAPTFRHKMYAEYKGTRHGMPDELRAQMPVIKQLLTALGITIVEKEGFEADDIIGTLSHEAERQGGCCTISTGDRDSFQLITDRVTVRLASNKEDILYTPAKIAEVYGVTPQEMLEVKTLMGDSSDNIPGVPGVGEKTALGLIRKYHTVQYIYDNLAEIDVTKGVRTKLENGRESAELSRKLAEITLEAPVPLDMEEYAVKSGDPSEAAGILAEMEMFSVMKKLGLDKVAPAKVDIASEQSAPDSAEPEESPSAPADIPEFDLTAYDVALCDGEIHVFLNGKRQETDIVEFLRSDSKKRTDDAISLFGDKEAGGIVLMRSYKDYYFGYEDADGKYHPGYQDMIEELTTKFPLTEERITGEQRQKEFIVLFGAILRMRNLLTSFDEFAGSEILSERDFQDYLGRYQDLRDEWKNRKPGGEKEEITDDIVFEIELIKQIEINIDYILLLVQKYHDSHCDDKEVLITIRKAVDASPELRSKKALIETFIAGINDVSDVMLEWRTFVAEEKERQLVAIIQEENLKDDETRRFMESSFRDGSVKTTGTDIDRLMPPISRFGGGNRAEKKQTIIEKLKGFFDRFFGIG